MTSHHSMQILLGSLILAAYALLSGCATIIHQGNSETLHVSSEPPGATVTIDGAECGITPMTVQVERKKDHTVVVTKEGFEETQSRVKNHRSWWMAGNIILGGLIGTLVDLLGGGGYTIEPNAVAVTLNSTGGPGLSTAPPLSRLTQSPPIP